MRHLSRLLLLTPDPAICAPSSLTPGTISRSPGTTSGRQLEQQAVLGLHVGEEGVATTSGSDVLVDETYATAARCRTTRKLTGYDRAVDADVAGDRG